MIDVRSKRAWALAGGYALLVALVVLCIFNVPKAGGFWQMAFSVLSLPWSLAIFLLAAWSRPNDPYAVLYFLLYGALVNCGLIYFFVARLSSKRWIK